MIKGTDNVGICRHPLGWHDANSGLDPVELAWALPPGQSRVPYFKAPAPSEAWQPARPRPPPGAEIVDGEIS
jgi:hypothetical protein